MIYEARGWCKESNIKFHRPHLYSSLGHPTLALCFPQVLLKPSKVGFDKGVCFGLVNLWAQCLRGTITNQDNIMTSFSDFVDNREEMLKASGFYQYAQVRNIEKSKYGESWRKEKKEIFSPFQVEPIFAPDPLHLKYFARRNSVIGVNSWKTDIGYIGEPHYKKLRDLEEQNDIMFEESMDSDASDEESMTQIAKRKILFEELQKCEREGVIISQKIADKLFEICSNEDKFIDCGHGVEKLYQWKLVKSKNYSLGNTLITHSAKLIIEKSLLELALIMNELSDQHIFVNFYTYRHAMGLYRPEIVSAYSDPFLGEPDAIEFYDPNAGIYQMDNTPGLSQIELTKILFEWLKNYLYDIYIKNVIKDDQNKNRLSFSIWTCDKNTHYDAKLEGRPCRRKFLTKSRAKAYHREPIESNQKISYRDSKKRFKSTTR